MILNHLSRGFFHSILLSMILWSGVTHAKQHNAKVIQHNISHVKLTTKQNTAKHKAATRQSKPEIRRKGISGHFSQVGLASWYGSESGSTTATGAHFNPKGLTAAHRHLALPTKVRVTNLKNHKQVIVTVNDRGPYHGKRILDLSQGAARAIGLSGVGMIKLETVS